MAALINFLKSWNILTLFIEIISEHLLLVASPALHKAGKHMENSIVASYAGLLLGTIIMDNKVCDVAPQISCCLRIHLVYCHSALFWENLCQNIDIQALSECTKCFCVLVVLYYCPFKLLNLGLIYDNAGPITIVFRIFWHLSWYYSLKTVLICKSSFLVFVVWFTVIFICLCTHIHSHLISWKHFFTPLWLSLYFFNL